MGVGLIEPGAGSGGGGGTLVASGAFDWGGDPDAWSKSGSVGPTFSTYESVFADQVQGNPDFGYVQVDPWNGDMGLLIAEPGLLTITISFAVISVPPSIAPTVAMFENTSTRIFAYSATGNRSAEIAPISAGTGLSVKAGSSLQVFIDDNWTTEPGEPTSLANVLFGGALRLPQATSDVDLGVTSAFLQVFFQPGVPLTG